jgi:hypothetical protein
LAASDIFQSALAGGALSTFWQNMRMSAARSGRYYQVTVRIESLGQGSIFAAVHESAPGPRRRFAAVQRHDRYRWNTGPQAHRISHA